VILILQEDHVVQSKASAKVDQNCGDAPVIRPLRRLSPSELYIDARRSVLFQLRLFDEKCTWFSFLVASREESTLIQAGSLCKTPVIVPQKPVT
jgi:hypothetical protein